MIIRVKEKMKKNNCRPIELLPTPVCCPDMPGLRFYWPPVLMGLPTTPQDNQDAQALAKQLTKRGKSE